MSEEAIRVLAGHVSKQMLQQYGHIRIHAKEAAIFWVSRDAEINGSAREYAGEMAQNWAKSHRSISVSRKKR